MVGRYQSRMASKEGLEFTYTPEHGILDQIGNR